MCTDTERVYGFQDGIIVHSQESEHGEEWKRVVVPIERRREILKLSHSSMTGGHFSLRKTEGILRRLEVGSYTFLAFH